MDEKTTIITYGALTICAITMTLVPGCLEKVVYVENTTRIEALNLTLKNTQDALTVAQENATMLENGLTLCQFEASACKDALINYTSQPNCTNQSVSNCTSVSTKTTTFTAKDMASTNDFLTKYPCFWETASRYGFGKYYIVADVAQSPFYHLPDVIECYWGIKEYTGMRMATGVPAGNGG